MGKLIRKYLYKSQNPTPEKPWENNSILSQSVLLLHFRSAAIFGTEMHIPRFNIYVEEKCFCFGNILVVDVQILKWAYITLNEDKVSCVNAFYDAIKENMLQENYCLWNGDCKFEHVSLTWVLNVFLCIAHIGSRTSRPWTAKQHFGTCCTIAVIICRHMPLAQYVRKANVEPYASLFYAYYAWDCLNTASSPSLSLVLLLHLSLPFV